MKFLAFFTKYNTKILTTALMIALALINAAGYSREYDKTTGSIKHINAVEETLVKIKSYPVYGDGNITFTGEITDASDKRLDGLKMNIFITSYTKGKLYPGDIIILDGVIFHTEAPRNEGGFDDIEYGKSLGTHGTVYCDKESAVRLCSRSNNKLMIKMCSLRTRFMNKTDEMLPPRYAAIAKALVTGDRTAIYPKDKLNLKQSGVYHIVAISGLHLNIFIMAFSYFISRMKIKRSKRAALSAVICTSVGGFVLIFTGFGASVIRAFVMLVISLGGAVCCRKYYPKNSLFTAAVIIVCLMPSSFYSVGFRLSVLSCLGVLISADIAKYLKDKEKLSALFSYGAVGTAVTSFVCAAVTLPVTADAFGYLSVYSFLANVLILPLTAPALGGCVIFGICAIAGLNALAKFIAYPLAIVLRLITYFADFASNLPMAVINLYPKYTLYAVIFALTLTLGLYYLRKNKNITAVLILFIFTVAVSCNFVYNKNNDEARVIFPYSGQGDAAVVLLPGDKAVMIDFGTSPDTAYTEDEVIKSLVKYNIRKLDHVFVSHFHTDHISGIIKLAEKGYIKNILVPADFKKNDNESVENLEKLAAASLKSHTPISYLDDKSQLKYSDDIYFDVISPTGEMDLDANEMSMVVKFTYGDNEFLFTGDISDKTTKYLYEKDIDCDVIKIPHHGSKSSNDEHFLKTAGPSYAVISCGENNVYEHPHKATRDTLKELKIKTYRTDLDGAVTFYIDKHSIKSIKTMR